MDCVRHPSGLQCFQSFDRVGLFLHIRVDLIVSVCPLKMYGLFSVIYLWAVFTSLAEIRAQAAGGDYRASTTTGHTTNGPGSQQEVLFLNTIIMFCQVITEWRKNSTMWG